ncbi:MAG: hypothetical protein H0U58_02850 [Chloroflexi bacterium]|nr:hypothetical protein [Chloroflexota bacterium]
MRRAASPATPRSDTAAGPARPASASINRATSVDEGARRLADDLRRVPGIERYTTVRLADLERSGPRPLQAIWRAARNEVGQRTEQLTVGELLDRYEGRTQA